MDNKVILRARMPLSSGYRAVNLDPNCSYSNLRSTVMEVYNSLNSKRASSGYDRRTCPIKYSLKLEKGHEIRINTFGDLYEIFYSLSQTILGKGVRR